MKLLFLTKNILAEQQLQTKLQLLGYEVFVSSSEFYDGLYSSFSEELIQCFDMIILSENLASNEVKSLLKNLSAPEKMVIRISSNQVKEEIENIQYVNPSHPVDHLRETLAAFIAPPKMKRNNSVQNMILFSVKEQLLYDYVKANDEKVISRETLCEHIWQEKLNDSRKSQLSSLVNKINLKLKNHGITNDQIQTVWGKGYKYSSKKELALVE